MLCPVNYSLETNTHSLVHTFTHRLAQICVTIFVHCCLSHCLFLSTPLVFFYLDLNISTHTAWKANVCVSALQKQSRDLFVFSPLVCRLFLAFKNILRLLCSSSLNSTECLLYVALLCFSKHMTRVCLCLPVSPPAPRDYLADLVIAAVKSSLYITINTHYHRKG